MLSTTSAALSNTPLVLTEISPIRESSVDSRTSSMSRLSIAVARAALSAVAVVLDDSKSTTVAHRVAMSASRPDRSVEWGVFEIWSVFGATAKR